METEGVSCSDSLLFHRLSASIGRKMCGSLGQEKCEACSANGKPRGGLDSLLLFHMTFISHREWVDWVAKGKSRVPVAGSRMLQALRIGSGVRAMRRKLLRSGK